MTFGLSLVINRHEIDLQLRPLVGSPHSFAFRCEAIIITRKVRIQATPTTAVL